MAGIPGDASDERCGVRMGTVSKPFECCAGRINHADEHLSDIRILCHDLRIHNGTKFEKLSWLLKLQLAEDTASVKNFEISCEGVLSLLYYGLVYPTDGRKKMAQTIFKYFVDKWFVTYDTSDFNQMVFDVSRLHQKSSFASVLLLYSHYEPSLSVHASLHILDWHSSELGSPQWLKELLLCSENTYQNFNKVLFKSLHFMNNEEELSVETDYLRVLFLFFMACQKYIEKSYVEGIKLLSSINQENCGSSLLGWNSLICGLCMEQLGKFHSSLMKYKEALQHSADCYHALYYSARIFQGMKSSESQLHCLKLLSLVDVGKQAEDTTLQSTLLRCHLPSQVDLAQRTLWLFAASLIMKKKWIDLPDVFRSLLVKWGDECEIPTKAQNCLLISPSDDIPQLPPKSCVRMGYMTSLLFLKEYQEVEVISGEHLEEDPGLEDFEDMPVREKIDEICSLSCHLMVAENLYQQGQSDKALSNCGRILTKVESLYGTTASWKTVIFSLKGYIYKLLSILYDESDSHMNENCAHFTRLQDHCCAVLEDVHEAYRGSTAPDQLVFEIIRVILNLRRDQL